VGIQDCLKSISWQSQAQSHTEKDNTTALTTSETTAMQQLMDLFRNESYALWTSNDKPGSKVLVHIMLKQGCSAESQLKAWCHGLMLAKEISDEATKRPSASAVVATGEKHLRTAQGLKRVSSTLDRTSKAFDEYSVRLQSAGWELGHATLETHAGPRFVCL
jgi:hypothetical protein